MTKILGIDPGSRVTGYGLIEKRGRKWIHIDNGVIAPNPRLPMAQRLQYIYTALTQLVSTHCPQALALERVFLDENPQTAIKLGQARGMALLVSAEHALELGEYTPLAVKQAIVGYGRASKEQIQEMVKRHFALPEIACEDASDALAIALTHAVMQAPQPLARTVGAVRSRLLETLKTAKKSSWRQWRAA